MQIQKAMLEIKYLKKKDDKLILNKTIKVIENMNCSFVNKKLCTFKIEILPLCFMMI